uniref:Sulfotransfer_1 domain-containing protein n=1 Tax=Steinernema glaseri TaxID=37863 RepID=A0A1I8AFC6_9BILA
MEGGTVSFYGKFRHLIVTILEASAILMYTTFVSDNKYCEVKDILDIYVKYSLSNKRQEEKHIKRIQPPLFPPVPPYAELSTKIRVVRKHKLAACLIQKNMSTLLQAIMCFLENPEAFRAANRTITTDQWSTRFCQGKNEFEGLGKVGGYSDMLRNTTSKMSDWMLYAFVRDPLERFVSGFVDKCVINMGQFDPRQDCHGCRNNISCFVHSIYNDSMEFLEVGYNKTVTMEDYHVFPQNWHCNFRQYADSIKLFKYRNADRVGVYKELADLLNSAGVNVALIDEILAHITRHDTEHATIRSSKTKKYTNEIVKNKNLLNIVYSIYFFDYFQRRQQEEDCDYIGCTATSTSASKSPPSSEDRLDCSNRIPSLNASSLSTPTPLYRDVAIDQATESGRFGTRAPPP